MRAPESGLMMNKCAVAGLCSAGTFSISCAAASILAKAEASPAGFPHGVYSSSLVRDYERAGYRRYSALSDLWK